jgi:hypothetical protein
VREGDLVDVIFLHFNSTDPSFSSLLEPSPDVSFKKNQKKARGNTSLALGLLENSTYSASFLPVGES